MQWKNKKVFLTGHTGFKGSWLSMWLAHLGAKVTGYSLEPPTSPSLFDLANVEDLLERHIIGDVRDTERLNRAMLEADPELVIHMAAQPIVRESYKVPVDTYSINVMGTVNVFESARRCKGIKAIVNVTTDKCYENRESLKGYEEHEALGGYDPYSSSKACSELVTSSYRRSFFKDSGVALASARAGNVIGGGDWATDRLIPDCIRSMLKKESVLIRNPHAIRPWQHVLEPLSGYMMLAEMLFDNGNEYAEGWNFGPDMKDAKPVEYIVKRLCERLKGNAGYTIDKGLHPHEAGCLVLDCSKAGKRLGWHPKWDLDGAIDRIVEWTDAYKDGLDLHKICIRQIDEYTNSRTSKETL